MRKFIFQIFALLICWSFVGVAGAVAISSAQPTSVGAAGVIGWITFCALGYLLCVDLLTVAGARRRG